MLRLLTLLFCAVIATSFAQAAPITWSSTQSSPQSLLSAGQSVDLTFDITSAFNLETDLITGFTFSWALRDNDADYVTRYLSVYAGQSCNRRRTNCVDHFNYVPVLTLGLLESARITAAGYDSGSFSVGSTCSGAACNLNNNIWDVTHTFADTAEGLALLQSSGVFEVSLAAMTGDFFVRHANLTVTGIKGGLKTLAVSEPGTAGMLLMGLSALVIMRRKAAKATS
ncbi:MAG: PEP-CTERM sorting domain-containing protein [Marinobacter sp.]|nr:PEP-CTERM sorting domain-containing protein [Marinobacter sp.]